MADAFEKVIDTKRKDRIAMSTIKMRAWDRIEKKMYYDNVGVSINGTQIYKDGNIPEQVILDRGQDVLIPMLSIGRPDTNNKDIYVGDITEYSIPGGGTARRVIELGSPYIEEEFYLEKILGNIYETPQLRMD